MTLIHDAHMQTIAMRTASALGKYATRLNRRAPVVAGSARPSVIAPLLEDREVQ